MRIGDLCCKHSGFDDTDKSDIFGFDYTGKGYDVCFEGWK